jgi:iron(III) transport system ATP-binding protein
MSQLVCESVCYSDVLHDVSLTLQRGKVCALLGPSGAGKSTLLWVLAGLWQHDSGNVSRVDGKIGMVFQQPGLWDHLTVEQHLKIVGADPNQIETILGLMKLTELRSRRPGRMSGGERQRLSIARALAINPTWLLLDEPMAHLDGPTRQDLFVLLRNALPELNAGVLIATHHAEEAMRLADACAILIDGRIVQQGTTQQVYLNPVSPAAASATGPVTVFNRKIYRPEQLTFTPDSSGDTVVQRCKFMGSRYQLLIQSGDEMITIISPQEVPIGVPGRIDVDPG